MCTGTAVRSTASTFLRGPTAEPLVSPSAAVLPFASFLIVRVIALGHDYHSTLASLRIRPPVSKSVGWQYLTNFGLEERLLWIFLFLYQDLRSVNLELPIQFRSTRPEPNSYINGSVFTPPLASCRLPASIKSLPIRLSFHNLKSSPPSSL